MKIYTNINKLFNILTKNGVEIKETKTTFEGFFKNELHVYSKQPKELDSFDCDYLKDMMKVEGNTKERVMSEDATTQIRRNKEYFVGGDSNSIGVIWNNIIGANFKTAEEHLKYLHSVGITPGFYQVGYEESSFHEIDRVSLALIKKDLVDSK
jgi:hypothetical protein